MLTHTIRQTIKSPLDSVYNCILDFKQYGSMHPYMVEVTQVASSGANAKCYAVKEDFLLYGFIPMHPAYQVTATEIEKNKEIQYRSDVIKGVHLTINFKFICNEATGCVEVTEEILLDAPILIRTIFLGILKKAHALFYCKLKECIGAAAADQQ